MSILEQTLVAGTAWDLTSFLKGSFTTIGTWVQLALMIVGIVAIGYAIWQITTGLMSHGKKQVNWAVTIILLLVGGVISTSSGFGFFQGIAEGGQKTIDDLGKGSATPAQTIVIPNYFDQFNQ